ncbi:MAG: hypothetical protein AB7P03_18345 [Kofleriaceae bacterium]
MPSPVARHFNQDASVTGTSLAFGAASFGLAILAALDAESRKPFYVVLPFLVLPGLIVLLTRLLRRASPPAARCSICRAPASVSEVRYLQHTGAIVMMFMTETPANACRVCSRKLFGRTTLHTVLLGWWGLASLFITPGVLLNNLLFLARSHLVTPRSKAGLQ